jgi:DNA-binding NtrC family response regulator
MALGTGTLISLAALAVGATTAAPARPHDQPHAVREFERRYLTEVLDETQLDKRKAADLLGISLASLYRKLGPLPDSPRGE